MQISDFPEKTKAEKQAELDAEYQRQQRVHQHRLHTAGRKVQRKITIRSRRANRSAA